MRTTKAQLEGTFARLCEAKGARNADALGLHSDIRNPEREGAWFLARTASGYGIRSYAPSGEHTFTAERDIVTPSLTAGEMWSHMHFALRVMTEAL